MNNEELYSKMNVLAKLQHDLEEAQLIFDMEHRQQNEAIDSLRDEIKEEIIKRGKSEQTDLITVQYKKGAVRWDTKWLDGYSTAHPEIMKYRTEGKPTVAFKVRAEGWADDGR